MPRNFPKAAREAWAKIQQAMRDNGWKVETCGVGLIYTTHLNRVGTLRLANYEGEAWRWSVDNTRIWKKRLDRVIDPMRHPKQGPNMLELTIHHDELLDTAAWLAEWLYSLDLEAQIPNLSTFLTTGVNKWPGYCWTEKARADYAMRHPNVST